MSIERYFNKSPHTTCYGEEIYGYHSGYPINRNPDKQYLGIINSVARML